MTDPNPLEIRVPEGAVSLECFYNEQQDIVIIMVERISTEGNKFSTKKDRYELTKEKFVSLGRTGVEKFISEPPMTPEIAKAKRTLERFKL